MLLNLDEKHRHIEIKTTLLLDNVTYKRIIHKQHVTKLRFLREIFFHKYGDSEPIIIIIIHLKTLLHLGRPQEVVGTTLLCPS
jgi:hypothetical protein